jgi:hypothetical protein
MGERQTSKFYVPKNGSQGDGRVDPRGWRDHSDLKAAVKVAKASSASTVTTIVY